MDSGDEQQHSLYTDTLFQPCNKPLTLAQGASGMQRRNGYCREANFATIYCILNGFFLLQIRLFCWLEKQLRLQWPSVNTRCHFSHPFTIKWFPAAVCMKRRCLLRHECKQFVKTPSSQLPATHDLMAVVMRDPFQLFKYYSCCQGDKDIIVPEFSKDRKRFCGPASEGYNTLTLTSSLNSIEHAVHFSRACSVTTA